MRTRPSIDVEELMALADAGESVGACKACGQIAHGVEPDAEGYRCEACGAFEVSGADLIVLEL